MTRKDYQLLAAALQEAKRRTDIYSIDSVGAEGILRGIRVAQQCIVEVLARDNPRFDRQRFDAAAKES